MKLCLVLLSILPFSLLANDNFVAKVLMIKGHAKAINSNGTSIDVHENQSLDEGVSLNTEEKSFVKLIFIDKSQMNLGPNSQMIVTSFPQKEAGIITLIKGQIRSQVTKDYLNIEDKTKSKLYIKTKTAALGIRGTDFQVNFNPENQNTSLITFEGKVAMANIDKKIREEGFDQLKLEKVVSSDKAVMVERGQISAVNLNVAERVMAPTLLGTTQINALFKNETGLVENVDSSAKQFRNPLPPGADSSSFINSDSKAKNGMTDNLKAESNGFFNSATGEYKLPAGSIIDLKTVNIIPPPANAVFDSNSKTFIVPENYGKIDKITGEYKSPDGLNLGNNGKFILIDSATYNKSLQINKEDKAPDKSQDKNEEKGQEKIQEEIKNELKISGSAPSNTDISSQSTNPRPTLNLDTSIKIDIPKIYDAHSEMAVFTERFADTSTKPPLIITDSQRAIAAERIMTTETTRQAAVDLGVVNSSRNVKFILNAQ
jgi:hypothetical protein